MKLRSGKATSARRRARRPAAKTRSSGSMVALSLPLGALGWGFVRAAHRVAATGESSLLPLPHQGTGEDGVMKGHKWWALNSSRPDSFMDCEAPAQMSCPTDRKNKVNHRTTVMFGHKVQIVRIMCITVPMKYEKQLESSHDSDD
jgi:hypothetical protein